jgi:uroporphyrinogen-III synthase
LVEALDSATSLQGKRVAVQEYGRSSTALHTALRRLGAAVQSVMIYRWRLPDQLEPLRDAVQGTIDGRFDVLAFTTAVQLDHVLEVAEQMGLRDQWLAAARKCLLASIGPTTSAALREVGLPVDIEPEHSKMGQLVAAIFEQAPRKKGRRSSFLEADTSSTR